MPAGNGCGRTKPCRLYDSATQSSHALPAVPALARGMPAPPQTPTDFAQILEQICDPEIEFLSMLGISGRSYRGHDGMRQYFRDVASVWEELRLTVARALALSTDTLRFSALADTQIVSATVPTPLSQVLALDLKPAAARLGEDQLPGRVHVPRRIA